MMNKLFLLLYSTVTLLYFVSCSGSDDVEAVLDVAPLPAIKTVSLNYHSSSAEITVSRDIQKEGATVNLKKGVSWINNLVLHGDKITFDIEENSNTSTGHRADSIQIMVNEQRIGVFCVTQARNPFSDKRLVWANSNALYRTSAISNRDLSGLEMTKAVSKSEDWWVVAFRNGKIEE